MFSRRSIHSSLSFFGICCSRDFLFRTLSICLLCFGLVLPRNAIAAFASQFSLSLGEEYNDNIFFTKDKEHDFVTYIFPTFSLLYAPPGETAPTFTAEFIPIGQIFARHAEETNFGDNILFNARYNSRYSPRLTFYATDSLRRLGETRVGGIGYGILEDSLPGAPGPTSGVPPPSSQRLGDFISRGDELTNQFSLGGAYKYSPKVSFTGDYTFGYTSFIDEGGSDIWHSVGVRGVYNWNQEHNLYAGYTISFIKSRNGDDNVVHNFDIGDDYLSSYRIELSPTLTLLASGGIGLNTGGGGPRITSRTNIILTKIWERASLSAGVNKGLTPSFGVSGISDTTSLFTTFRIRLTEFLTAFAAVDYSLYDTDDVNFNTFQASTGLQYRFTSWLTSNLRYAHHRIDSGSGAASTDFLTRGKVNANSVLLLFTARFDVWPNVGLARGPVVR